jgi:hypothetical protein
MKKFRPALLFAALESDRSLLKPGEYEVVTATLGAEGKITASRVQVSKDGVKQPV